MRWSAIILTSDFGIINLFIYLLLYSEHLFRRQKEQKDPTNHEQKNAYTLYTLYSFTISTYVLYRIYFALTFYFRIISMDGTSKTNNHSNNGTADHKNEFFVNRNMTLIRKG